MTRPRAITNEDLPKLWQEAELYEAQGLHSHALELYRSILKLEPDNTKARDKVVELQFGENDTTDTTTDPSVPDDLSPRLSRDLGLAYMGMNLYAEAINHFVKALKAAPTFKNEVLHHMAVCLIRLRKYDKAKLVLNEAIADPTLTIAEKAEIIDDVSASFADMGRFDDARWLLESAPAETHNFIDDYDNKLADFAAGPTAAAGDNVEVYVEDDDTGRVYKAEVMGAQASQIRADSVVPESLDFYEEVDVADLIEEVEEVDTETSDDENTGHIHRLKRFAEAAAASGEDIAPQAVTASQADQPAHQAAFIKVKVHYSHDGEDWHESSTVKLAIDAAVINVHDTVNVDDTLIVLFYLSSDVAGDPIWVVTKVPRIYAKSPTSNAAQVELQFISFLPGGKAKLQAFLREINAETEADTTGRSPQARQAPRERPAEPEPRAEDYGASAEPPDPGRTTQIIPPDEYERMLTSGEHAGATSKLPPTLDPDAAIEFADTETTRSIRFACECGQIHTVNRDSVGVKGRCGNCRREQIVPRVDPKWDRLSEQVIGKTVGGCRILYKIGGGGMGGVFRGHHLGLDIPVAIKILHAHLAEKDPVFIKRFIREARAAARLQHPNIVGVMNVGYENGMHYLVMPYISGGSAAAILYESGPLNLEQVLDIGAQVATALTVAEEHNILHRDIKPANILITEKAEVKLADLGLAKNYLETGDSGVTQTGIACGTPLYFSPEQAKGSRDLDIRSDVYSLGITLYHLLEGSPPFTGESAYVIFQKHVHEDLPPFKRNNPPVPESVYKFLCKMTAKKREERYGSAAELLEAIEALRDEVFKAQKIPSKSAARRGLLSRLGITQS